MTWDDASANDRVVSKTIALDVVLHAEPVDVLIK
jgi:hypothetical protein